MAGFVPTSSLSVPGRSCIRLWGTPLAVLAHRRTEVLRQAADLADMADMAEHVLPFDYEK